MNYRNLPIVVALIIATAASFLWGGYHILKPFMFISGLILASAISLWSSLYMETRSLVTISIVTLAISAVDEYTHTSSEAFIYFDGLTPSPLTVFGWGLLVLGILAIAQFLNQKIPIDGYDSNATRALLVLIPTLLLVLSAWAQGYLRFFSPLLISVYIILFSASLHYSYSHRFGWSIWVVVSSLIFSAFMEYLGGIEGLWVYQSDAPMAVFIVFTWVLRVLTIMEVSSLLGVEIQQ